MSYYTLTVASEKTEYQTQGTSPAKALRTLTEMAGLELASQDGRYGRLTDGRNVAALTQQWSRRRVDPLERTTRV